MKIHLYVLSLAVGPHLAIACAGASSSAEAPSSPAAKTSAEADARADAKGREGEASLSDRPPEPTVGRVGQKAHLFFLRTENPKLAEVEMLDLNALVGERAEAPRTLVLSFAAWYCDPCKLELAEYGRRRAELERSGATLAVVVMDEEEVDRARMTRYLVEEVGLTFPVVEDGFQLLARKYGVRSLPHTVIIGPEGIIRKVNTGYRGEVTLEGLLADIASVR